MPLGDRYGAGDTPEQVGSFPEVAAEIVAGYRADVLESVEPVIRGLSEADLETTNPDRNLLHPRPAPTFNWVLARSAPSTSGKCPTYEGLCRTRRVGVDRRWLRSFWVRREYAPSLWENAGLRGPHEGPTLQRPNDKAHANRTEPVADAVAEPPGLLF